MFSRTRARFSRIRRARGSSMGDITLCYRAPDDLTSVQFRWYSCFMLTQTIGFIGAGQMARALAQGFVAAGLVPGRQINYCDPVEGASREFGEKVGGAV